MQKTIAPPIVYYFGVSTVQYATTLVLVASQQHTPGPGNSSRDALGSERLRL